MMSTNFATQPAETFLINKVVNGNLEAFNQLVLTHQNMAYNHAYAMLGDPALAEDATQDSFIKAFQGIQSFRGGSFRGWLLRIVTNSAYDILRRSSRRPTQPLYPEDENGEEMDSASWLADPSASVQDIVEQDEFSKSIYKLVDELPDVYRTILTMIDMHEFDYAETANALNIPVGTVKSCLARARLQMKNRLSGALPQSSQTDTSNLCLAV